MTSPAVSAERPALRVTPTTLVLVGIAGLAWVGVVAYARHMGNGSGSMGLPVQEFLPMWGVMMTAMMLPAVAPVAALYTRTIRSQRAARLSMFVVGYLAVWLVAGVPTYVLLRVVDHVAGDHDTTMRWIAVVVLLAAGVYQLSPLKAVCLRHCRSPIAQLLHYGNVKGRLRDVRVSLHHAAYCLGCCWALMVLFVAFGVMNIWAMLVLAAVVVGEKALRHGVAISRVTGVACVVLALLVLVSPRVTHALVPSTQMASNEVMTGM